VALLDELQVREAAMRFLDERERHTGGLLRFDDVRAFTWHGDALPLLDLQRGIRKPRQLSAALSFRTVWSLRPEERPYADGEGEDGYLRYKWRGDDPLHPENVALRSAMEQKLPLIWFNGVASGVYVAVRPVWLIAEEPLAQQFVVALDADQMVTWHESVAAALPLRRAYAERVTKQRLHQPLFRARVLIAYDKRCALCRLKHPELLDAAHIRSDSVGGEPVVPNGIAMCKIHHAAFDQDLLGVRPDLKVEVRASVLAEIDGPMLLHGLQEMHGSQLTVPTHKSSRPDVTLLEERYERFRAAS
jgi:putative restriction endonuclease